MHYGYSIVEDMQDGLLAWMADKGFATIDDFRGLSFFNVREWKQLNLNYQIIARIHEDLCIGCQLCYTACWDGAHQCIHLDGAHRTPAQIEADSRRKITVTPVARLDQGPFPTPLHRIPHVDEQECVGCNLCWLVCPVEDCIQMVRVDSGSAPESWAERTAKLPI